jgi:hypothetical protein
MHELIKLDIMKTLFLSLLFMPILTGFSQSIYAEELAIIKVEKHELKVNDIQIDSVRKYLLDKYNSILFPFWIGTPWDYNGHTNTPKKDEIACGYFVSTTLKHLGFNWNRYTLAKMYSKNIVESVCDSIYEFDTKTGLHTYVRYRPDNLYIVGLSGHVGLILKYKGELWFIHSDYHGFVGPIKETIESSVSLSESNVFWCGTFLSDKNIEKWLKSTLYGDSWN